MKDDEKELVEQGYERLERRGLSRRDFVKMVTLTCVAFGIDMSMVPKIADAAAAMISKKPLIWMQGQGCTGCSSALLTAADPGPADIILDVLSVRYHPNIMAAAGDEAVESLESCIKRGSYVLVLEGSIPLADPRYCTVEGKPFIEQFKHAAEKADLIIAAGSCACYGGIPRAGFTGALGAKDIFTDDKIKKKIVNLPSCPVKPDRLVGTILHYVGNGELPPLDKDGRPTAYYRYTMHDSCYRRLHYERKEFLKDWNDPKTVDWCLYEKGCKGIETYTTCASKWWNDGVNFCVAAGSPCAGCSQPQYYDKFAPLYENPKGVK